MRGESVVVGPDASGGVPQPGGKTEPLTRSSRARRWGLIVGAVGLTMSAFALWHFMLRSDPARLSLAVAEAKLSANLTATSIDDARCDVQSNVTALVFDAIRQKDDMRREDSPARARMERLVEGAFARIEQRAGAEHARLVAVADTLPRADRDEYRKALAAEWATVERWLRGGRPGWTVERVTFVTRWQREWGMSPD